MQRQSLTIWRLLPCQSLSNTYCGKQLPVLLLSATLHGISYFFGQFGSAVLAVFPPNLLPNPSLLSGAAVRDGEDNVQTLCKHRNN